MRILVFGSGGFIGRHVANQLGINGSHEVVRGTRSAALDDQSVVINLVDYDSVIQGLKAVHPDIVVNCAGVISGTGDFDDNVTITKNILQAANEARIGLKRYVLCGSAGEYGPVDPRDLPVSESQPLRATSPYATSKVREELVARDLAKEHSIELVVARIFNPLGANMPAKFILPNLISQINDIKNNLGNTLTVSRLDSKRDYVNIDDASKAIASLATKDHLGFDTYNIGSGVSTTTKELVDCIIECADINSADVLIKETADVPEQSLASQANIARLEQELGWKPDTTLRDTVQGAVKAYYESKE